MAEPKTISELLGGGSRDAPAFEAPGRRPLSYSRLRDHVEAVKGQLAGAGIGPDHTVAIVLPNGPEMASAFVALASAAVTAPLNPAYREKEFTFYLEDLDADLLLTVPDGCEAARLAADALDIPVANLVADPAEPAGSFTLELPPPVGAARRNPGPDDTALVLHTSGTTSRPKIVPLSHANLCSSALHIREALTLSADDRCLNVMPLFHIHGLMAAVLGSLAAGASVHCAPGFDALRFFGWFERSSPTWYTAVPTMHQAILGRADRNKSALSASRLRFVRSSSAALAPRTMQALEDTFEAPVIEAYGMTEASHQMSSNPLPPGERRAGSVGVAAGPEIAILDEGGSHVARGGIGEVAIRGPNVTSGYRNNPEANAACFTDGWFRTGDQGFIDPDGYLHLTGRLKELINRGGEKISPREVDEVLIEHPAVAQAVCFAVPHRALGEEVAAALVLRPDREATAGEIKAFAAERLADFKVPRRILIVDEIPKGPTGKLQRIGLAEKLGLAVRGENRTESRARGQVGRDGLKDRRREDNR